jgi:hypothetical protein
LAGKFFLRNGMMAFDQCSSIFSKKMYSKVGGFRQHLFRVCGDLDLYQRIALVKGSKVALKPYFCSVFLKYGESLGDRSVDLYKVEYQSLEVFNGYNIAIRFLHKLDRTISRFFV